MSVAWIMIAFNFVQLRLSAGTLDLYYLIQYVILLNNTTSLKILRRCQSAGVLSLFAFVIKSSLICSYFERQFEIAEATKLPLFLHMRAAASDFLDIVKRNQHRSAVHSLMCGYVLFVLLKESLETALTNFSARSGLLQG